MFLTLTVCVYVAAYLQLAECGNYTVTDEAWFDVEVEGLDGPGSDFRGKFVIALFGETVPMTVMNFAALTRGYQREGEPMLHFKNTPVHRVVPDFVIQMGDVTKKDGSGGRSIYGEKFVDENFLLSHRSPGWVAMANKGRDTNGSQFFVLLCKARWLDGKHVVFGKVIRGFKLIQMIGEVPTNTETGVPKFNVTIVDCGLNDLEKKYDLPLDELDSVEDRS